MTEPPGRWRVWPRPARWWCCSAPPTPSPPAPRGRRTSTPAPTEAWTPPPSSSTASSAASSRRPWNQPRRVAHGHQQRHDDPHLHLGRGRRVGAPVRCHHPPWNDEIHPGLHGLGDGTYYVHCQIHPQMTGTLVVGTGGPVPSVVPSFEQPLVEPHRKTGHHIRIVMREGQGPGPAARAADADVDLRRHLPRADHRPPRRPGHEGHLRQPAASQGRRDDHPPARRAPDVARRRPAHEIPDPARQAAYLRLPAERRRSTAAGRACASTTTTGWTGRPGTTGSACRDCS